MRIICYFYNQESKWQFGIWTRSSGWRTKYGIFIFHLLHLCTVLHSSCVGRMCNLLLLLGLASAAPPPPSVWVLWYSRRYFIVPMFKILSIWRARSPYSYTSGTKWPSYTPAHWVPTWATVWLWWWCSTLFTERYSHFTSALFCFQ
jgi:hypothetical protein